MKNFIINRANKEFLIFLFFFALSGIFWLMMSLNETYEKEVSIVVRYTNVEKSKNAVLTSNETDTLHVTISDKGFNILSYLFGQAHHPLEIDFATYAHNDGTGTVTGSAIKGMVAEELPASSKVISIKPDRLLFYYNNGESMKVPVMFRGNATPQPLYYVAERQLKPDSVTIYASRQKLDSIKAVFTEELNCGGLHDTATFTTRLVAIPGVKIVPGSVNVRFIADVLTEACIEDIPIQGINMPQGKRLRTFPTKTNIHFVTGMNRYKKLTPADFSVVADYNEFSGDSSQKCNIYLIKTPKGVTNAKPDISQVDYLIEATTP